MVPITSPRSGLVDITRDFLRGYQITRRLAARCRTGDLRFDEVQALVGDDEASVLFRLKERCHSLFRDRPLGGVTGWREALFDLAVGSLFHEAMKFRENFYQREIYAPRVEALRNEADEDAAELFREFEKIQGANATRLDESLDELAALLSQTRTQFRHLLAVHRNNGLVTRFLVENPELVEDVFEEGLDCLLAELHGSPGAGYTLAASSYLDSGYFADARRLLAKALSLEAGPDLDHLVAYADGMSAYLEGRYGEAVDRLDAWLEAAPETERKRYAELAHSAVSRVGSLVEGDDAKRVVGRAEALAERLAPHARATA